MRNIEAAQLLAVLAGLGASVGGPSFGPMNAVNHVGRVRGRLPGIRRNPAGTKLAKKAAKGTLTINGIRHDKEMSQLHPIFVRALAPFMPAMFTEAELIAADLAYLEGQARRARELVDMLHELELNRLREAGGI